MADDEEDITIDLRLRDYLASGAEAAAKAMDDLADNTKQASRALLLLDKRATKAAASLYELAAATRAADDSQKKYTTNLDTLTRRMTTQIQTQRQQQRQLERTSTKTEDATKKNKMLAKSFQTVGRALKPLGAGLALLAKGLALVGAAGLLGPLTQNLLGVVAALSSMVSFAALIPIVLGGGLVAMMTAKLAFSGLADAIKAATSGDAKALEKAFKGLGPSAKSFVKELTPALKLWKGMKDVVQGQFLSVLDNNIPGAVRRLAPIFKGGMKSIAVEFGLLFNNIARFFNSAQGDKMFGKFFQAGVQMLSVLRKNVGPFLDALSQIIDVAWPYWNRFIKFITSGFANFNGWLEQIAQNGQLKSWLDTAINVAKALWQILSDVGTIISSVIKAAGGAGQGASALGLIGSALGGIAKWASSLEGQASLVNFFSSLNKIATALMPIITLLAGVIANQLAPTLAQMVQNLAPGVMDFIMALSSGVQQLLPYLPTLATGFSNLLTALAPLLPVIADLLAVGIQELINLLPVVTPLLSFLAQILSTTLQPFLEATAQALTAIQPAIMAFITAFTDYLPQLMPLIQQMVDIFAQLFQNQIGVITAQLPTLIPLVVQLGQAFGEYLLVALQQLAPLMPSIVDLMSQTMQIGFALAPILLLVATAFLKMATFSMQLAGPLIALIGLALQIRARWIEALNAVLYGFSTVVQGVVAGVGVVVGAIGRLISAAGRIAGPFVSAAGAVAGAIGGITGAINNAVGGIENLIGKASSLAHLDLNPFRFAGGDVIGGKKYTVGEIGPEMWVGANGQSKMIGTGGMDPNWTAPGSGTIIPSFMLDAFRSIERSIKPHDEPAATGGISAREIAALLDGSGKTEEHHHYDVKVDATGATATTPQDIERAVYRAIDKIERDRKERK